MKTLGRAGIRAIVLRGGNKRGAASRNWAHPFAERSNLRRARLASWLVGFTFLATLMVSAVVSAEESAVSRQALQAILWEYAKIGESGDLESFRQLTATSVYVRLRAIRTFCDRRRRPVCGQHTDSPLFSLPVDAAIYYAKRFSNAAASGKSKIEPAFIKMVVAFMPITDMLEKGRFQSVLTKGPTAAYYTQLGVLNNPPYRMPFS